MELKPRSGTIPVGADKRMETAYSKMLNKTLRVGKRNGFTVLDLFAGCGGLALGFESVGFQTIGYELNRDCCNTYRVNLGAPCNEGTLTENSDFSEADVVIGGPPCQPFSVGGRQRGDKDSRDGFPAFISAVKKVKPRLWMFENVRGLLYRNKWYLDKILEDLSGLGYTIDFQLLNAVDYGVPQNRERLIVVGHMGGFEFPAPEVDRVNVGAALGELLNYEPSDGKYVTPSMDQYIKKYEIASKCINPRDLYANKPSRTVTCRNLAGATGDMLRIALPSGRRRRLGVLEAARLQSFPDWYQFQGKESSVYYQIGNAVPPMFARKLAECVLMCLSPEASSGKKSSKRRQPRMQLRLGYDG